MNSQSFTLAERLIPATYLQQAAASKKARENLVRILIEQVRSFKIYKEMYCSRVEGIYTQDGIVRNVLPKLIALF